MPIPLTVAPVDGIMAPRPRSAIEAFRRAFGLTADGQETTPHWIDWEFSQSAVPDLSSRAQCPLEAAGPRLGNR